MKAITKILIVLGFATVVACIAGAVFQIHSRELPHAGLLTTESTQNSTSPPTTTDTNPETVPSDQSLQLDQEGISKRTKRAIIFRPLFVYRQQEIKKQRYKEMREQQQQTTTTTQRPKYASGFAYGSSYISPNNMRG